MNHESAGHDIPHTYLPGSTMAIYESDVFMQADEDVVPRFQFRDTEYTRQSLEAVQEAVKNWQIDDSSVIGATVFGSTTKGYDRYPTSDVDVTVFIDADAHFLSLHHNVSDATLDLLPWGAYGQPIKGLGAYYSEEVRRRLGDVSEHLDILRPAAEVYPISHELVQRVAERVSIRARDLARYLELRQRNPDDAIESIGDWSEMDMSPEGLERSPAMMDFLRRYAPGSPYISLDTVWKAHGNIIEREDTELARLRLKMVNTNRIGNNAALRLFTMAITDGVSDYRRTFLRALGQSSDPDEAWRYFAGKLAAFEDSVKHPRQTERIAYPRTYAEACDVYGVQA